MISTDIVKTDQAHKVVHRCGWDSFDDNWRNGLSLIWAGLMLGIFGKTIFSLAGGSIAIDRRLIRKGKSA